MVLIPWPTATFNQFEIHNGTGDTVVICLGDDCENAYIVKPFEPVPPNIVTGESHWWATRFQAGLQWRETETWTSPPQYGSFFGTPQQPDYIFGIPPGDPPTDPVERGKWLHAWALSAQADKTSDAEPVKQLDTVSPERVKLERQLAHYFE